MVITDKRISVLRSFLLSRLLKTGPTEVEMTISDQGVFLRLRYVEGKAVARGEKIYTASDVRRGGHR